MIKAMAKQYPGKKRKCYEIQGGKKICASKKAWSVFFAKLRKEGYDETKPKSVKVEESEREELSELEKDILIEWFLKTHGLLEKSNEEKGKNE